MSRDQMVMTLLPIMEKCPMDFYQEVVVVTRYKEICQSHIIEVMKSLPPETEYLMELLNEVGLLPRFECF